MPVCIAALGCAPPVGAQTPESADLGQVQIAVGRGQVRSIHGLTRSDFENTVTGSSPLLSMARLPGVSFSAADTLGNYEWSTRIAVRGFSQNQLGFTLDDVPLGDMSYANYNGLHISRAISSENVARAFVSQGSGALETASSSNLGGTLQFYSGNPLKDFDYRSRNLRAATTIVVTLSDWTRATPPWGSGMPATPNNAPPNGKAPESNAKRSGT